jgi:hypothetical protein
VSLHDLIPIILVVAAGLTIVFVCVRLQYLRARCGHLLPFPSARAAYESTGTTTSAAPASDNNWRWARRIEADQRIAEAALRKAEAAAISALEQTDEFQRQQPDDERLGRRHGAGAAERCGAYCRTYRFATTRQRK